MSTKTLRRLHRWIGLICALSLMGSAGSGLLHTAMTYLQAPPPRPQPAAALDLSTAQLAPSALLSVFDGNQTAIRSCTLCQIDGENYYQVLTTDSPVPRYFRLSDGEEVADADQRYALQIARQYAPQAELRYERRLDQFDSEYIVIYRLLPVHLIHVDDDQGTRFYVSTQTASIARHTNNLRQIESASFSLVHKWMFIPWKPARDLALGSFTLLSFLIALSGVVLFFKTRR